MGNLRHKKRKFRSRKQLANGDSISFSRCTVIGARVNSDRVKTIIATFVLKIINSDSVSKTTFTRE